jgi:hypothetical protein
MHRHSIRSLPFFLLFVLVGVGCSDSATPAPTPTAISATTNPTRTTETTTVTPNERNASTADPATVNVIESITDINSYRFTLTTLTYAATSSDVRDRGASGFSARGAVVKEPEQMALLVRVIDYQDATSEFGQNIGYRAVDGRHYAMQQDMWGEISAAQGESMSELTVFSVEAMRDALSGMNLIGRENVGSRPALHYQGGAASMDALTGDRLGYGLDEVESAQFDVWIDEELNFISRVRLSAEGTGTPSRPTVAGRIETDITYYDINDSIMVQAPNENGDFVPQDPRSPESIAGITSYRFTHSEVTEGIAFSTTGSESPSGSETLEGAVVKNPYAEEIRLQYESSDEGLQENRLRVVEGKRYIFTDDQWTEAQGTHFSRASVYLAGASLVPQSEREIANVLATMTQVGTDAVQGRPAIHYQGGSEAVAELTEVEDGNDWGLLVGSDRDVQLDLWLDGEFGYVLKVVIVAEGAGFNRRNPTAEGRIELSTEYFDINAPITIAVP